MRDGAICVLLGYAMECLIGVFVSEGVEERDGAIEFWLHLRLA